VGKWWYLYFPLAGCRFFLDSPHSYGDTSPEGYVGVKACVSCHGAIVRGWQTTAHARAFQTLKQKSQERLPACVRCHVVGFEKNGGYVDEELTPELTDVQCEACHGPAAAHVANPSSKGGLMPVTEATCRNCHTPGQDPHFDFAQKKRFVHGISREGGTK